MKTKHTERSRKPAVRPVRYSWTTPDGAIYHGRRLITAESRSRLHEALRRFWSLHETA